MTLAGVIGHFTRDIGAIRDTFQHEDSASLKRRRKIIFYSVLGTLNASLIVLKQSGILKQLPDIPLSLFDANKVTSSSKAYEMGLPDAAPAIALYGLVMSLASYGGKRELRRLPLFEKLLLAAVLFNAVAVYQYLINMAFKQKKICLYCVTAGLINSAMIPGAVAEAKR